MSKARTLANLISDNAELADGQISVAEVVGAAPTASPTFTGTVNADAITMSGFLTVNGGADFNTVLYPDGISMADSRTISFGTSANFELNGGSTFLDFNLKDNARHLRIKNGLVEHHRFSGNGSVVFNDSGADADFRVESDNNPNMLFVDGGANRVGIGRDPQDNGSILQVAADATASTDLHLALRGVSNENKKLVLGFDTTTNIASITSLEAGVTHRPLHLQGSQFVWNEDGSDHDFRVESDSNDHMLFVDAGNNKVGINSSVPEATLDVKTDLAITEVATANATSSLSFYSRYSDGQRGFVILKAESLASGSSDLVINARNSFTDAERLRISSYGDVTFTGDLVTPNKIAHAGDTSNYMQFHQADGWRVVNSTGERFHIQGNQAVFNHDSHDADFRVESDSFSHMLFVDGGANVVAFGQTQNIAGGGMYFNHSNATRSHLVVSNTETSFAESLYYGNRQNSDGHVFQFRKQNSTVGNISVNSSGTTYNTTSDRRLKDNIEPIADATDKLMAMNPVTHTWIADPKAPSVHGFIAQEMQEVVPEAVSGEDGGEEMMSMDYGRITPVLVAALQEAINEIKALEERLTKMEVN